MNLDELRSVQSKERQKDSLQNLRPSFYQEVGEYIADLEAERDRAAERAEDPFSSPEVSQLTDEIETAKDVVEAVYERRMGKLVKQASLAAAGMPANDEGLTAEEADLFDDLVARIGENKSRVLDVLEGVEDAGSGVDPGAGIDGATGAVDPGSETGTEPGTAPERTVDQPVDSARDPGAAESAPPDSRDEDAPPEAEGGDAASAETETDASGVSPADVMGGDPSSIGDGPTDEAGPTPDAPPTGDRGPDSEPQSEPRPPSDANARSPEPDPSGSSDADSASAPASTSASSADVDRTTVRITRDIGSILGIDDREYTLSSDDVVTLPEENAEPLVEREAAERLE